MTPPHKVCPKPLIIPQDQTPKLLSLEGTPLSAGDSLPLLCKVTELCKRYYYYL
jgi:hypothetical protein